MPEVGHIDVEVNVVGGVGTTQVRIHGEVKRFCTRAPAGAGGSVYDVDVMQDDFGSFGAEGLSGRRTKYVEEGTCTGLVDVTVSNAQFDGIYFVRFYGFFKGYA